MLDSMEEAVTRARISALYDAEYSLKKKLQPNRSDYESAPPWRYVDNAGTVDKIAAVQKAITDIQDEIISLEYSLRDPEADAEMRYEINAAIAASGNWEDNASDYMHTPMQERLYQESIYDQIRYEDDSVCDYWSGPCPTCGGFTDSDSLINIEGHDVCDSCYDETVAFMHFLSFVTRTKIREYRYSWSFVEDDDD